jgi:hypothetical protein
MAQSTPDAIVMAILCDFKGVPEKQIVHGLLSVATSTKIRFKILLEITSCLPILIYIYV